MAFSVKSSSLKYVFLSKVLIAYPHPVVQRISTRLQYVLRHYANKAVKVSKRKCKSQAWIIRPRKESIEKKTSEKSKIVENTFYNYDDNLSAVLYKAGDLRLEQSVLPMYGDNEVLIATECVGLAQSEVNLITKGKYKDYTLKYPLILGHETTGTVAEIGYKVTKFKRGDRVAIESAIPCRTCDLCKMGRFNLCPNISMCGMPPRNGTLTRFFAWPEDFCLKLPDNVAFNEGALLEPFAIAHHACKRGGIIAGSKVVIYGAGPIGLLTMLCAKALGAATIVVIDTKPDRLRCANTMGANTIIYFRKTTTEKALTKDIIDALRGQAHVCLECSGAPQAVKVASEVTIPGGTIVLVGVGPVNTAIRTKCTAKEIDIRGVQNYCNNYQKALNLIACGRLNFKSMITHNFQLSEIMEAIKVAKSGRAIKILIHTNPKWIPTKNSNYY